MPGDNAGDPEKPLITGSFVAGASVEKVQPTTHIARSMDNVANAELDAAANNMTMDEYREAQQEMK